MDNILDLQEKMDILDAEFWAESKRGTDISVILDKPDLLTFLKEVELREKLRDSNNRLEMITEKWNNLFKEQAELRGMDV